MTKDLSKRPQGLKIPVSLLIALVLSLLIICPGCLTQSQVQRKVDAYVFKNNFKALPAEYCQGPLNLFGFYRIVTVNGEEKKEFISICKPEIDEYLAMYDGDIKKLIKELVPEPTPSDK